MSAKIVDKKEKKDLIIKAAIHEFARKGFAATTIHDIAAAASIGKGTVYEYFRNKHEIIQDAFKFFVGSQEMDLEEILLSGISAREKLLRVVNLFSRLSSPESSEIVELLFIFWSEGIKSKDDQGILLKEMNKLYRSYRGLFTDIILEGMNDGTFRKNISPGNVAAMIVGAFDGILFQWLLDKESIDFSEMLKTLNTTILNGISDE